MRLTKAEIEQDSEILGAIITGDFHKPLLSNERGMERPSSVCAVGAGNIGRRVNKPKDIYKGKEINVRHERSPFARFAEANEVSKDYVCGVNDGFEQRVGACRLFYPRVDTKSKDYARGWDVGQAARIYSETKHKQHK